MKCNVDASFRVEDQRGSIGVALRDHDGQPGGGRLRWYDYCLNALTAEAMVCLDDVKFAQERRVTLLHLETDCQVLVTLWEKQMTQNSKAGPILQQIHDLS